MKSLIERIKLRCQIEPATGCWLWRQTVNNNGYPMLHVSGLTPFPIPARRLMYLIACGPLHAGRVVISTCGDRLCMNPMHLRSMPRAEVARRTLRAVNERLTTRERSLQAIRRRSSGQYKLDEAKAAEIRRRLAADLEGQTLNARMEQIGAEFGVSKWTVALIKYGRRWAPPDAAAWHP